MNGVGAEKPINLGQGQLRGCMPIRYDSHSIDKAASKSKKTRRRLARRNISYEIYGVSKILSKNLNFGVFIRYCDV